MSLQITDIQAQKKREGYYSIFINEEYSFSLSELDLSTVSLHIGQSITKTKLAELRQASLASKAYSRAIYYLRYGPRSVWQMRQYLKNKAGFETQEIEQVIVKLEKDGYLNDEVYIDSYLNSRQISRPRSKRQLNAELRKKGISPSTIDIKLSGIDEEAQLEAITILAKKKLTLPRYRDRQKLTEYLVRQGFPYSQVITALKELEL